MTIQFLAQWSGYEAGGVYTLSDPEEVRLVAAGLARVFFAGMDGASDFLGTITNDGAPYASLAALQADYPVAPVGASALVAGARYEALDGHWVKMPRLGNPYWHATLGQSNEVKTLPNTNRAAYPLCFKSAINPNVTSIGAGSSSYVSGLDLGGMWCSFYDSMIAAGIEPIMHNFSVGSLSLVDDVVGKTRTWAANAQFGQARAERVNEFDNGYTGDLVFDDVSGNMLLCVTGCDRYLSYDNPYWANYVSPSEPAPAGYKMLIDSGRRTGATIPDFYVAPGTIVTDGSVQWRVMGPNILGYKPPNYLSGAHDPSLTGYGLDPFGVLRQIQAAAAKRDPSMPAWALICMAQSDLAYVSTGGYKAALITAATMLLRSGINVACGMSAFVEGGYVPDYEGMGTAISEVVAQFVDNEYGFRVISGGNLYTGIPSPAWHETAHLDGPSLIAAGQVHAAALIAANIV